MKKTDRKVFVPLLNAVADLHGKKLSDAVVGIYWDCLQAIDLAAFQTAMRELTMESEYMPKPCARTLPATSVRTIENPFMPVGKLSTPASNIPPA